MSSSNHYPRIPSVNYGNYYTQRIDSAINTMTRDMDPTFINEFKTYMYDKRLDFSDSIRSGYPRAIPVNVLYMKLLKYIKTQRRSFACDKKQSIPVQLTFPFI